MNTTVTRPFYLPPKDPTARPEDVANTVAYYAGRAGVVATRRDYARLGYWEAIGRARDARVEQGWEDYLDVDDVKSPPSCYCSICGDPLTSLTAHPDSECRRLAAIRGNPSHEHAWEQVDQASLRCRECLIVGQVVR